MSASDCRGQRTATGEHTAFTRADVGRDFAHVRAPAAINATIRAAPARVPSASPRHRHHGARNSCTETGDGPAARRRCPHRQGLAGPHCTIGGRSGSGATSPRIAPATWSWRSEGRMVRWAPRFFLTKCRIDESGRAARCGVHSPALLVVQIETGPPEQRIGAAAELRNHLGGTRRRQEPSSTSRLPCSPCPT